jgi:hypothetical protein
MPTKAQLEAKLAEEKAEKLKLQAQIAEAKRQQTHVPSSKMSVDDGGSHSIDHLTILDNHEMPDTNAMPAEDIPTNANDLSFWGGSWAWNKAAKSYGNKPEDSWFINPTPKLIGEVMHNAPLVHGACEVALLQEHKDQLDRERKRHLDFLRDANDGEIVSECLDLLTAYQGRYFESVQQYLGRCASYDNQAHNGRASDDDIEAAEARKLEAAHTCRGWVARLIALIEAYHAVQTDERAYNLTYDFAPAPSSSKYGLYKWTVTTALNKIGRRLTRSVKTGTMDAERYRIPRPWLDDTHRETKKDADAMLSDFA